MAYVIIDDCINCGICAEECPADAIAIGGKHYEIDSDKCINCGICEGKCPIDAIEEI